MEKKTVAIQKVVEIDWSKVQQVQKPPPQPPPHEDQPSPPKGDIAQDAAWKAWEASLQERSKASEPTLVLPDQY